MKDKPGPSRKAVVGWTAVVLLGLAIAVIALRRGRGSGPAVQPVCEVPELQGIAFKLVELKYGTPAGQRTYTVSTLPTKSWYDSLVFKKYPKTPENASVEILLAAWPQRRKPQVPSTNSTSSWQRSNSKSARPLPALTPERRSAAGQPAALAPSMSFSRLSPT